MTEEKKYSLISVDTGDPAEPGGVRTTRTTNDGEETIVVSSNSPVNDQAPSMPASDRAVESHRMRPAGSSAARADVTSAATADTLRDPEARAGGSEKRDDADDGSSRSNAIGRGDNDEIPFKRMQTVIIVSLIVVIAAFLVYFNFLR